MPMKLRRIHGTPRGQLGEYLTSVTAASYTGAQCWLRIPLQPLACHAAILRGTDIDKPRNLAKSVTVE